MQDKSVLVSILQKEHDKSNDYNVDKDRRATYKG